MKRTHGQDYAKKLSTVYKLLIEKGEVPTATVKITTRQLETGCEVVAPGLDTGWVYCIAQHHKPAHIQRIFVDTWEA